jgi:hypothetical protein
MKEPAQAINKNFSLTGEGIHQAAKSHMVLSKQSLIHSDSFQPKI